ncbi:unnamed protein product [Alternaria alternata]
MYLSNTTLTAATLVVLFQNAAGMCYNLNGTAVYGWDAGSIYQPCSNDTTSPLSSVCCALNRANPSGGSINDGFTADVCLPSGLCQNILTDENGSVVTSFWRDYCTSAEWEDGKCLSVCTGAEQHADDGTAPMTPCGNAGTATKWCCGTNNTACCSGSAEQAMLVPLSLAAPSSTTSASSSPTSSPTSSVVTKKETSGLSTGAKAGIGIGAAVGSLALIGVVVGLVLCARRRAKEEKSEYNPYKNSSRPGYHAVAWSQGSSEMDGRDVAEMGTDSATVKYRQDVRQQPAELA